MRREAAKADREAGEEVEMNMGKRRQRSPRGEAAGDDVELEQEPLMEGEVMRSQEGVKAGEERAYAHRDIKPGESTESGRIGGTES